MSSSKPFCLVFCLLCTVLPTRAEKPNNNRANDDSRSSGSLQQAETVYTKEWGGKLFRDWIRDLRHPDPTYRVAALIALQYFKQNADAVPEILARLHDDGDASVRIKAAKLLGWIRPHETDRVRIIRGLAHALHDPQSVVRYEAAASLQSFCPFNFENKEERDALQDLVACLRNTSVTSSYELREICIDTLMKARVDPKTGPDPKVTEALITHANPMNEAAARVRIRAITALGAQGRPQDPKLLQRVMGVLRLPANFQSKNPSVRIWSHVAVIALEEKVNKKDLDTIANYLKEREAAVRLEAVTALGALEDKSQDYVGNILDMLKTEEIPTVKAAAALALGRMKVTGQSVLNRLIRMTEEDDRESVGVVLSACQAFVLLGTNNAEVVKAMDKVLEHKSLENYQKAWVRKMIEELQAPRKKQPAKEMPKALEKGTAPKQNKGR
jgi:HEAT repeat protein